jgi:pSer/pThr/pTyr-binding forkhead associated (FHA) protein
MQERSKFVVCPKCTKQTPLRSGSCLYCGALLDGARQVLSGSSSSEKILEEPRQLGAGGASRFQKTYDGRGHYIFLGAREPIPLEANKLFVIGRDPHASLVIHSPEVSRQHCEIDWRGDPPRPVIVEVRARNGTFINDRPIHRGEPEPLRDRDVVRLGRDFELVYRQLDERELKEMLSDSGRAETRAIPLPRSTPPVVNPSQSGAMPLPVPITATMPVIAQPASMLPDMGDLAKVPGALLLDTLHREARSGKLTVFDGQTAGDVALSEGRAKSAIFGPWTGREALEQIARLVRGAYRFVPDVVAPPIALTMPMAPAAPPMPAIPPELLAAYHSQLAASVGSIAPPPPPAHPVAVPPELAAILAAVQGQQAPPQPAPPIRPATSPGFVAPLKESPAPSRPPTSRSMPRAENEPPPRAPTTRPPSELLKPPTQQVPIVRERGASTGARSRSDVLPLQGARAPSSPPTSQPRGSSESARLRSPDPYVTAPPPAEKSLGTGAYRVPQEGPKNGETPEGREASALLATVRALGLTGEGLGAFVGDTTLKLMDEGKLTIALELAERGLDLADKGSFEDALATRMAFKAKLKSSPFAARSLEAITKSTAQRGGAWAVSVAKRTLKLIDPETPPDPKSDTVLGRLAAIARA